MPPHRSSSRAVPGIVFGLLVAVALLRALHGILEKRAESVAAISPLQTRATNETAAAVAVSAQAAQAAELVRLAEANRVAEHDRVERGIVGRWKVGSLGTLTITSDGERISAQMPVQVTTGVASSHTVIQTLRGEILPNNQVKLTNNQVGKLVNPYDYYQGPFGQEAWIILSADGKSLTARFTNAWGNSAVVLDRMGENTDSHEGATATTAAAPIAWAADPKEQASQAPVPSDQVSAEERTRTSSSDVKVSDQAEPRGGTGGSSPQLTPPPVEPTPAIEAKTFNVKVNMTGSHGGSGQYVFLHDGTLSISDVVVTLSVSGANGGQWFSVTPAKILGATYQHAGPSYQVPWSQHRVTERPEEIYLRLAVQEMDRSYKYKEGKRDIYLYNAHSITVGVAGDGGVMYGGVSHVACDACDTSLQEVYSAIQMVRGGR
jgi:hypothetical protein